MRNLARSTFAAGAFLVFAMPSAWAIDTNIKSYVCQKLDDFTASVTVVKADQRELNKIGKDFGTIYKFKEILIKYKEPNKVRMDGRTADGFKGIFIVNGTQQWVSIPKLHYSQRRDFKDSPGKRKSLIDVGLVSDFYLTYTNAKYLRTAVVDGTQCAVFDMTYKDRDADTSHHTVFIDPKTKVIRRRESYSQEGKLQAVYLFKNVKEIKPGVWFPTLIEAVNTDQVTAGSMAYKDIKVNSELSDDEFKL